MTLAPLCVLAGHGAALLDYMPPTLYWSGHYAGYEYRDERGTLPVHTYPVHQMLDGDPNTAWMVGGLYRYSDEEGGFVADRAATVKPKLFFVLPKAVRVDGIRIMPGYNKSNEVFQRNNRITEVSLFSAPEGDHNVYIERPFLKSKLKDQMGWHEVKFPPRDVQVFEIEVTDFVKGADNDFCVSEVQLLSGGEPIDWKLTTLFLSTIGSDCGCGTAWHVIDRKGKAIREAGTNEFDSFTADPTGRYVFSNALTKNYFQFYILDMKAGKFVAYADRPRLKDWYVGKTEVEWKLGQAVANVHWDIEGSLAKQETITLKWKP